MRLSQRPQSEWAAASAGRLEIAGNVVCFPEMSEESFSNPLLPCWEPVVGEASHRTYDTVDKRDSVKFKKDHFGLLVTVCQNVIAVNAILIQRSSGCH